MLTTTVPRWEGITLRVRFNPRPRAVVRGDGGGRVGQARGQLLASRAERALSGPVPGGLPAPGYPDGRVTA